MKRMLTAVLALLLALSLCACGAQDTDDTPTYPAAFSSLETLIDTAREEPPDRVRHRRRGVYDGPVRKV